SSHTDRTNGTADERRWTQIGGPGEGEVPSRPHRRPSARGPAPHNVPSAPPPHLRFQLPALRGPPCSFGALPRRRRRTPPPRAQIVAQEIGQKPADMCII